MDALANVDVLVEARDQRGETREAGRPGAEVEVVVFDLGRPIAVEGVLDARAEHPAIARVVDMGVGERRGEEGHVVLVVRPGAAALHEYHGPVEREAEARGGRAQPVDLGVTIEQGDRCAGVAGRLAIEIGPAELSFRAQHPCPDLVVGADLRAAEEAGGELLIVVYDGQTGECVVHHAQGGTGMDADVHACPAEDRRRRFIDLPNR